MAGNGRVILAFGLIGVMLVALFLLLRGGNDDPAVAETTAPASTSISTSAPTTTTVAENTTTSPDPDARLAEVEAILEDLEIRWYDAVYRGDESVLPEIVAVQPLYDAAVAAMGSLEFVGEPTADTVDVEVREILLDRPDCLVVFRDLDLTGTLGEGGPFTAVQILWPQEDGSYRLARLWSSPSDLWQDDCDLMDRTQIP